MFKIFNSCSVNFDFSMDEVRNALACFEDIFTDEYLFVIKTDKINFIMSARYNDEEDFTIIRSRSNDEELRHDIVLYSQMLKYVHPNSIDMDTMISRISSLLVSLIFMNEIKYVSIEVTQDPKEAFKHYTSKYIKMDNDIIIDRINNNKFERETIAAVVVNEGAKFNSIQLKNFLEEHNLDELDFCNLFSEINKPAEEQYVALPEGNTFIFDNIKASQDMGDFVGYIDKFNNVVIENDDMVMINYDFIPSKYKSLRLL